MPGRKRGAVFRYFRADLETKQLPSGPKNRSTALSLVRTLEVGGLYRVAIVQGRAGAGDEGIAFLQPAANLDIGVGSKPGDDAPGFHHAVPDHLHAGAFGSIGDGGARYGDAAAAAGI